MSKVRTIPWYVNRDFPQDLSIHRLALSLDLRLFYRQRRPEFAIVFLRIDLDLVIATFLCAEGCLEDSPAALERRKLQLLTASGRTDNFATHWSLFNRVSGRVQDRCLEEDSVTYLWNLRCEGQTNAILLREMPLVRHPAHNLAPEPVMVLVFDPTPPAPGTVRSHEQHLSAARRARHQQWNAPPRIPLRGVDRNHL